TVNPRSDFKEKTLKAVFESPNPYILFAVDDIVVKDHVNLTTCIKELEKTGGYGFFLHLGKNLRHCYTLNQPQALPPLIPIQSTIHAWQFKQGSYDWAYPNSLDMTI